MLDNTNLARDVAATGSADPATSGEAVPEAGTPPAPRRKLPNFDFDTPDEESVQFAEEQWLRFCRSIGLEGDVPDIRPVLLARGTEAPPRRRQAHWLVRPFLIVFDWFSDHP